jgi:2-hydroxychromene-2-carboxylate isomerase
VSARASFYFDLQSPLAYLAAERVLHELPRPAEWQPVLARELQSRPYLKVADEGGDTRALVGDGEPGDGESKDGNTRALLSDNGAPAGSTQAGAFADDSDAWREEIAWRAEIERQAERQRLQPLRWPAPFPFDSTFAMRAATYAKSIGRVVPFAQAAFRQAFAGGRALDVADNVLIAAAACEMHPSAVLRGAALRSVATTLDRATESAAALGVPGVPAVVVGEEVFAGERAIERAAERMLALGAPAR